LTTISVGELVHSMLGFTPPSLRIRIRAGSRLAGTFEAGFYLATAQPGPSRKASSAKWREPRSQSVAGIVPGTAYQCPGRGCQRFRENGESCRSLPL
jgi:hypothetical protein